MKNKKCEKHLLLKDQRPGQLWSYDAVFDLPVSEYTKIVYFNLCRRANKEAQAHPSFAQIANKKITGSVLNLKKSGDTSGLWTIAIEHFI